MQSINLEFPHVTGEGGAFGGGDQLYLATGTMTDSSVLVANTPILANFLTNTGVNPYVQTLTAAYLTAVTGFTTCRLTWIGSKFVASIIEDVSGAELQQTARALERLAGQTLAPAWTQDTGVGMAIGVPDDLCRRGFSLPNPPLFGGADPAEAGAAHNIAATADISIPIAVRAELQWNIYYQIERVS